MLFHEIKVVLGSKNQNWFLKKFHKVIHINLIKLLKKVKNIFSGGHVIRFLGLGQIPAMNKNRMTNGFNLIFSQNVSGINAKH